MTSAGWVVPMVMVALWGWLPVLRVDALERGYVPMYDKLCNSPSLPSPKHVAVPWDCTGFVQCQLLEQRYLAVWVPCSPGLSLDPKTFACVTNYKCQDAASVAVAECPDFPELKFPHPGSCSLYYDCSQSAPRGVLKVWEAECPYPTLFDSESFTCVYREQAACDARLRPNERCDYRTECPPPTCQSLNDGQHPYPGQAFSPQYLVCAGQALSKVETCRQGTVYDPVRQSCQETAISASVEKYCTDNPTAKFPHLVNCSMYYDCSARVFHHTLPAFVHECPYLFLYDLHNQSCQYFKDVACRQRFEPKAPCDYMVGHCLGRSDGSCLPCEAQCLNLPDGLRIYPGRELQAAYMECESERTKNIRACPSRQVFDPLKQICTSEIDPATFKVFCQINPMLRVAHPSECAQYYDCQQQSYSGLFRKYLMECTYPYLYDQSTGDCRDFRQVSCGIRNEPSSLCDYLQFQCVGADCVPCLSIMPDCQGKTDGSYPLIGREMTAYYVVCQFGRVKGTAECPSGQIFDMVMRNCSAQVSTVAMTAFCAKYPRGTAPDPSHCGRYYDCQSSLTVSQTCPYPDQYSVTNQRCEDFFMVSCHLRTEYLDPCEYKNSPPCLSCKGREDGHTEPIPGTDNSYFHCRQQRVIKRICAGTYDTSRRMCTEDYLGTPTTPSGVTSSPNSVNSGVTAMPNTPATTAPSPSLPSGGTQSTPIPPVECLGSRNSIIPDPVNCAHYTNCADPVGNVQPFRFECAYPELFDQTTLTCRPFNEVNCGARRTPISPCEYVAHQCRGRPGCIPCEQRLVSCRGLPDGYNSIPGLHFSHTFVSCQSQRTLAIINCPRQEFFDPVLRKCVRSLNQSTINEYCAKYGTEVFAHPLNCAQFVNCAQPQPRVLECGYPKLFAGDKCYHHSQVNCGDRFEPVAPCDYLQNQVCPPYHSNCPPCPLRLPSCVGLPDGRQPFPNRPPSSLFIRCEDSRTLTVIQCRGNIFSPSTKTCGGPIAPADVAKICSVYPDLIFPDPSNCARYYNCRTPWPTLSSTPYLRECQYPAYFSLVRLRCQSFDKVLEEGACGSRYQPVEPCEYLQNCPNPADCSACLAREPTCLGLNNGYHGWPLNASNTSTYIYCEQQRVQEMSRCRQDAVFDSTLQKCKDNTTPGPAVVG